MRHPIEHAHASLKANIWLLTKPTATSDPDGRNHLTGRTAKAKTKAQLATANNGRCGPALAKDGAEVSSGARAVGLRRLPTTGAISAVANRATHSSSPQFETSEWICSEERSWQRRPCPNLVTCFRPLRRPRGIQSDTALIGRTSSLTIEDLAVGLRQAGNMGCNGEGFATRCNLDRLGVRELATDFVSQFNRSIAATTA